VSVVVEGWGPFRATAAARLQTAVPPAGTVLADHRRYLGEISPWRRRDGIVAVLLAVLGCIGVGICWNGASREAAFRDQIGWTVGAFLFLGLYVLGGVLWLMAGFRRVRHGIHELQADMSMVFRLEDLSLEMRSSATDTTTGLDLVVGPGMERAHRPDCLLAKGKHVRALTPSERSSYPPCGLCM
jgi:hypothetical protein